MVGSFTFSVFFELVLRCKTQKFDHKRDIIRRNDDNVTIALFFKVGQSSFHKWHKGPLEQWQLFVCTVAMVNIVSIAAEKTLITHSSEVGQS